MLLSDGWLEEFQQCIIRKHNGHTLRWRYDYSHAGVTGDMVPSADPVLGTKPAGGSRSHWRIWFWQEPHPPCGTYGGLDSPTVHVRTSLCKRPITFARPKPPKQAKFAQNSLFFIPTWYKLVVPTIHHARFQVKNNFAENTTMEIRVKPR